MRNSLAPIFWFGIAMTIVFAFTNIIGWTAISWWVVFYPVLIVMSYGFLLIIGITKAVPFLMSGKLTCRDK